jgi:hypothetical protein
MKLVIHETHRDSHWAMVDLTYVEGPRVSGLAKALHWYEIEAGDLRLRIGH